jgi:hypothetical protein
MSFPTVVIKVSRRKFFQKHITIHTQTVMKLSYRLILQYWLVSNDENSSSKGKELDVRYAR